MPTYDFNKIREMCYALLGINKVFEDATKQYNTVEEDLVLEYERFIQQGDKDLPNLLIPFDRHNFFSHAGADNHEYYRSNGIKAHLARNMGILKSKIDENDKTPVTQIRSFHFVSDLSIRRILERDYQEIQRNMITSSWKSAIILSGGSIEAILLDLLSKNSSQATSSTKALKESNLNKWDLNDLVEVAVEEKMIGSDLAKLSHTVREYRNLIHPGVEIRNDLRIEPEEAKIAVEVLHILIRELS